MPLYKVPHQTHLENCSSQPYSRKEIEMRRATYKSNKEHQENEEFVLGEDCARTVHTNSLFVWAKWRLEGGMITVMEAPR